MGDENKTIEEQTTDLESQVPDNKELEGAKGGEETKPPVKLDDFSKILGDTKFLDTNLKPEGDKSDKKDDKEDGDTKDKDNNDDGSDKGSDKDKKEEEIRDDKGNVIPIIPDPQGKPERDFTGFGEQTTRWLKRMPYNAYEFFSKVLREKANNEVTYKKEKTELEEKYKKSMEGKTELPESYYEHPNAVVLSEDYAQVQAQYSLAQNIENHWKQQLQNIKAGKDWYDLIENDKGQIFVAKNPTPATPEAEVEVSQYFNRAIGQTRAIAGEFNVVVRNFQTRHTSMVSKIKEAESKYMSFFDDPKTEEYKFVEKASEQLASLGINKNNPVFNMLSKSIALNVLLKGMLENAGKQTKVKEGLEEDRKKAGPSGKDLNGGGGKAPDNKGAASLDDFKRYGLKI